MSDPRDEQIERLIEQGPASPLGQALSRGEQWRLPATDAVDREILAAAHQHLVRRGFTWRIGVPLAAAAAVALAATVALWQSSHAPRAVTATVAADIDRSGTVDILDAYLLARSIQQAEALPGLPGLPGGDINADGVVDQRDADAVAMQAVALEGGRG